MKTGRLFVLAMALCLGQLAGAQELTDAQKAAAEAAKAMAGAPEAEKKVEKPQYWDQSLKTNIKFGQSSLTNWAAGGDNTVTLQAYIDGNSNYKKDKVFWNNRLQLDYGFVYASSKPILQKSDDRIYFESKFGYKNASMKNFSFSANYDFKSQFSTGYDYLTPSVPADKYPEGTGLNDLAHKDQVGLWKDARKTNTTAASRKKYRQNSDILAISICNFCFISRFSSFTQAKRHSACRPSL